MSKFNHAAPLLASLTGLPIFEKMAATHAALPMAVGLGERAKQAAQAKHGMESQVIEYKIGRALWQLSRSKRYRLALMAPDAMRHDENGQPVAPVSASHKSFAAKTFTANHVAADAILEVAMSGKTQRPEASAERDSA